FVQRHVRKQVGRKEALCLAHDRVAGDSRPSLLDWIPTSFFHEADSPLVELLGRHVRQLDTINLCDPGSAPTVDVIESLAPAFDLENLRSDLPKAPAVILERFRLARPVSPQLSQKIAH